MVGDFGLNLLMIEGGIHVNLDSFEDVGAVAMAVGCATSTFSYFHFYFLLISLSSSLHVSLTILPRSLILLRVVGTTLSVLCSWLVISVALGYTNVAGVVAGAALSATRYGERGVCLLKSI